jgi:ribosomal protein L11 methyltransferase
MLEVAPGGFEERESAHGLELAAYLAAAEAQRVVDAFPGAVTEAVAPGWQDAWRRFHRPVRVGRVWVGPPWEMPEKDAVAVVIDPGRAFGTGAHPTTRLCLELLQELEPGAFVDLGCGSGVLSIAAAKLGFGPVFALDVDPAAVEVAVINAAANGVDVDVRVEDVVCMPPPPADVAVANIALDAAEALAPRVQAGRLVTSGYLARDPIRLHGWKELEHRVADGWGAHVFAREGE